MAVLLNELFFPQSDLHTTSLLSAFSFQLSALGFCTTFVFRPFGALLFGWIGDNIGRKSTVVITTLMMAFSCFVMAVLPTYAQIGLIASCAITLCRVLQGISSMGEITGAGLYLTETIKPPSQYMAVSLLTVFSTLGGVVALFVASIVTSNEFNWRFAFFFGLTIAVVGGIARTRLRETPDFVNAKRDLERTLEIANIDKNRLQDNPIVNKKVNIKTSISYFLIQCTYPVYYYVSYIHCGNLLKTSFGYNAEQIINQNLILSIVGVLSCIILSYLSYKIYPLKILKNQLLILIIFINFVSSFGLIYLTKAFGYYGLLVILIPITIGFGFGLNYFYKLERETGEIT